MNPDRVGSDEPLYNIGVISRMTNIPETTLRVWERRYGFPESARTSGGHRLYSQMEFVRLQWVKMRLDEGMQISQAIQTLQHMERQGRFPEAPLTPSPAVPRSQSDSPSLITLRERLKQALFNLQAEDADQLLADALALYTIDTLLLDVFTPTFMEIGEAWSQGDITVATEHFATHYLRHQLMLWMRTGPTAYQTGPVMLACAPDDWHEGGLIILGVLLRRLRWPILYLGASVPLSDLANFIQTAQPSVLVLSATLEATAQNLMDWPQLMPEVAVADKPVVTFGGRAFTLNPALVEQMPGVYLGETLQAGLENISTILRELNPFLV